MTFTKEELLKLISEIDAKGILGRDGFGQDKMLLALMRAGLEIKFAEYGVDALSLAKAELAKADL